RTITQNREKIVLQEGEAMANVFKKVSPATVSVITESVSPVNFFGTTSVQKGAGSGLIISSDGYVLTNKHVVPEGITKVSVMMADGKQYNDVTVVGRDPLNDIAFLKIAGVNSMAVAELGDSSLVQPGQRVAAIGNALGQFRNSITAGIISGIGRPLQATDGSTGSSEKLENLLQTDAAINPGNSGGPLVTLDGKVIGINVATAESAQTIGFAIPINDAKRLVDTVRKTGKIVKPYLGARYVSLTPEAASSINVSVDHGAYISGGPSQPAVLPGSPADKAGLREHDIILKVNDIDVTQQRSLASIISGFGAGDKIKLTIQRDGKESVVTVTLEAYPTPTSPATPPMAQ
ncbi:MAG TPA: trypsin-like peptidase domain-containing protein, partial [Patescibacteria group bacterium]|nr:trypsin-like peptidase domain-containing protein [Patescibacteria group bacterium]